MVRLAFYGDDVTGSVDALLQLRRAGLDGVLVTSPAAAAHAGDADVVGIAGIARSLPTPELAAEIEPAFSALLALRPRVLQYKVCSTADSSPDVGSIGRAIEIGRALVGAAPVPVLFAQPGFGRWTVFGHHFAAEGGQVHRIDRQPTMAHHPVTPATESDLRRHLAAQTGLTIAGVSWLGYGTSGELDAALRSGADVVVLDALTDEHLQVVGRAVLEEAERRGTVLAVGSGGLSRGLGLALAGPDPVALRADAQPAAGRTLVLSGSASPLTWTQVGAAREAGFVTLDLFADDTRERAARAMDEHRDVVVHSTSPGVDREASSDAVERRLADIGTDALHARPTTRLVVCGGDTSGKVLRRLGVDALSIDANPWGMVSLCRASGSIGEGIEIVLKGGQMGDENVFDDVRRGAAAH